MIALLVPLSLIAVNRAELLPVLLQPSTTLGFMICADVVHAASSLCSNSATYVRTQALHVGWDYIAHRISHRHTPPLSMYCCCVHPMVRGAVLYCVVLRGGVCAVRVAHHSAAVCTSATTGLTLYTD